VTVGRSVLLLGFGCTVPGGDVSSVLQIGSSTIKSVSKVGASSDPAKTMEEYTIVAGDAAVCQGDSGGAAYIGTPDGPRKIIGVNSRGNISTTSYLTNVSDSHILAFLQSWKDTPICGIHSDAKGC
jgi:hypothetical protein